MVNALLRLVRFVVIMATLSAVLVASLVLIAPQAGKLVSAHRSDHEQLDLRPLTERSLMFDRNGGFVASLIGSGNVNRAQVALKNVPRTVRASIIAVEDNDFYRHTGVNARSIGRAIDANLSSGQVEQGGSTISQQVIKDSQVGNKQTFKRKIREALLALELEKELTKNQILSRYVNSVYFGNGAYGVQAAAQVYFNKDVSTLNWAEGALLAALIRSPSQYDPIKNPELARERRDIVFRRLRETRRLTADEVRFFQAVPLPTKLSLPTQVNDYFPEAVKQELLNDERNTYQLGATKAARANAVFGGGLRIYTTFDPVAQQKAIVARNETVAGVPGGKADGTFPVTYYEDGEQKSTFGTQAVVSIQPNNGAVRVMVGGPGFETWKFNLALGQRQPGSSMKTFVLAALFENGFVPDDTVSGASCTFPDGSKTHTVSGKGGTRSITQQTQASNNCAFLRLGQVVGLPKVVDVAKRLGITSPLEVTSPDGTSFIPTVLPLGPMGVRPFDMAAAYSVFANDGVRNTPYLIERIEDSNGRVIYQHQAAPQRVIPSNVARLVNRVLVANVMDGTGTRARLFSGQPAAGKTGTTNDSADVWFVGYTPQMATAIWMGAVDGRRSLDGAGIAGATGARFPAATWGSYTTQLLAGQPNVAFPPGPLTRRGRSVGKIPNEIPYRGSQREED